MCFESGDRRMSICVVIVEICGCLFVLRQWRYADVYVCCDSADMRMYMCFESGDRRMSMCVAIVQICGCCNSG